MFYVYLHIFPNGKKYCGFTKNPQQRWSPSNYARCPAVYNAILKYGWSNIKHEIIFESEDETLAREKEKATIAELKLLDRRYGYNLADGGLGGASETIREMWQDPDSIFNSSEYRANLSQVCRERTTSLWKDPNSTFNSKEFRLKKVKERAGGAVVQCDLKTHEPIKVFLSAKEATQALKGPNTSTNGDIHRICKQTPRPGRSSPPKQALGYWWRYATEEEEREVLT